LTELERKQERAPVPKDWTYAPAPEARDIVRLEQRYGHFVGGALQCCYWDFCAYRKHVCSTLLTQGDMADERSSAGNGWRNLDWGHGYGGTVPPSNRKF